MKLRVPLLLLAAALTFAACGDDDGGSVTEAAGDGSQSASASGSGSGSASGSASGSHAGADGECVLVGNTEAAADTVVQVALDEWTIEAETQSVEAGVIEFEAENVGEEPHELVIVKGAAPEDLTITEAGLDEEALPEGAEVLGEIEGFDGGTTCAGHFDLEPGAYSLVCNIVEEDEAHAHEGMVTAFTVT